MTSAEYAGDTSLFVGIQNVLLRENGGNFYAYITGTDLFTGITHGGDLPEIRAKQSTKIWRKKSEAKRS